MIPRVSAAIFGLFPGLLVLFAAPQAAADLDFSEGRWRLDFTGSALVHSGGTERGADRWMTASVEYEVPSSTRATLGLRLLPVFFYDEAETTTLYGAGLGLSGRLYQHKEEKRGLYGELGVSALWHSREIKANSSKVNFLSEVGFGYQFKNDWHLGAKYQHFSNAGLGSRNRGINGVGLSFGFCF